MQSVCVVEWDRDVNVHREHPWEYNQTSPFTITHVSIIQTGTLQSSTIWKKDGLQCSNLISWDHKTQPSLAIKKAQWEDAAFVPKGGVVWDVFVHVSVHLEVKNAPHFFNGLYSNHNAINIQSRFTKLLANILWMFIILKWKRIFTHAAPCSLLWADVQL